MDRKYIHSCSIVIYEIFVRTHISSNPIKQHNFLNTFLPFLEAWQEQQVPY